MENQTLPMNKNKVSIQILETTAGRLLARRSDESETINSVIERLIAQNEEQKVAIEKEISDLETSTNPAPIMKRFARNIQKFRADKIVNEEIEGKYLVTLFGVKFFAQKSLGELYATFVEVFAQIAPEAINSLRDSLTPQKARSYLTWDKGRLYIKTPDLFDDYHRLTSEGYVPTNIGQNEAEGYLRKLCEVAGIEYGKDMIWVK